MGRGRRAIRARGHRRLPGNAVDHCQQWGGWGGGTSITALTSGQKARQRRKGRRWWRENERRRREDEDGDTSPTQTSRRRLRATLTACFRLHGKAATVTTDGGAAVIRAEKKLYLLRCFRRPVVGVAVIKCHFSLESQSASEKPAHTHIHAHIHPHTGARNRRLQAVSVGKNGKIAKFKCQSVIFRKETRRQPCVPLNYG